MKSKNTYKTKWNELIKRAGNFLKRDLFTGVMAAALFVLSGCQDQVSSIKPYLPAIRFLLIETPPEPKPVQFASQVTLNEDFNAGVSRDLNKDAEVTIPPEKMISQYNNTLLHNLKSNRETWKESYDGVGVPILRILF